MMNALFPENSYAGKCSCGKEFIAPKGVIHCHVCLYAKIAEREKERDALTLKCTMLEAEFESALDLTDSICSMNTKKERLATYQQYLTTTTFETTLAKRDIEQRIDAIELLCCKLKADSFLHKETHDMAVEFTKQLREGVEL